MILASDKGTAPRELIPAGVHVARCYAMYHIGTIPEMILGEEKKLNKIMISFELPEEIRVFSEEKGEQPFSISKEFTLSLNEKANLRKMLDSWRGKPFTEQEAKSFDVTKLLGVPCLLNIVHRSSKDGQKTFNEISTIMPLKKGMPCPEQINPTQVLEYDNFNDELFKVLPMWIKEKVMKSDEYRALIENESNEGVQNSPENENDTSLPF